MKVSPIKSPTARQLVEITANSLTSTGPLPGKMKFVGNSAVRFISNKLNIASVANRLKMTSVANRLMMDSVARDIRKKIRAGETNIRVADNNYTVNISPKDGTGRYVVILSDKNDRFISWSVVEVPEERDEYCVKLQDKLDVHPRRAWDWQDRINLKSALLQKKNLTGISLAGVNLEGAQMQECRLNDADLSHAIMAKADLQYANLQGANLVFANLEGASLVRANLKGANLALANLERANLACADLEGANFYGANLKNVYLMTTRLEDVHLMGANLEGVNLEGARLNLLPNVDRWDEVALDFVLNHYNNKYSFLTTLQSIDNKYADIKIAQAHLLKNSLVNNNISPKDLVSVAKPLVDVLGQSPFTSDPVLAQWIKDIAMAQLVFRRKESMPVEDFGAFFNVLSASSA